MFISRELLVIQFTETPRVVVARYDGNQPSDNVLRFFGEKAKVLSLGDVGDFWVDETKTVCGKTEWVVISLGLFVGEDDVQDPLPAVVLEKLIDLLRSLVDREIDSETDLIDLATLADVGRRSFIKPTNQLKDEVLRQQMERLIKEIEK